MSAAAINPFGFSDAAIRRIATAKPTAADKRANLFDRIDVALNHRFDCVRECRSPLDLAENRREEPSAGFIDLWDERRAR